MNLKKLNSPIDLKIPKIPYSGLIRKVKQFLKRSFILNKIKIYTQNIRFYTDIIKIKFKITQTFIVTHSNPISLAKHMGRGL